MSIRLSLGTETSGLLCVRMNGITAIDVYRNFGSESQILDALLEARVPPRTTMAGDQNARHPL